MEYKSFMEALKGNQHKLDKNKNGKVDAHDFKLLRKEEEEVDESVDRVARADYKVGDSGRKSHKEITFKDGSESDEKEEVKEAKMSDADMAERERIVKGMKKNIAGFKSKYGERAKEVMYATATKQAMKEESELEEAAKGHTIEAHGIKGMKGTPWRKTFKSVDHMNDWADKNDSVEVHGTRDLEKSSMKEESELEEAAQKVDIPAYLRKKQGQTPLKLSDLKRKDTLSDKENLAKLRNEESEELDEKSDQAKKNKTIKNMMDTSRGARYKLNNPVPPAEPEHKTAQAHNKAIGRALRNEQAPVAPSLVKHKISVTVSEPDHPMVSKRKEKIQKTVIVTHSDNKEGARAVGEKFYKKKGYRVHDSNHVGVMSEESQQEETMSNMENYLTAIEGKSDFNTSVQENKSLPFDPDPKSNFKKPNNPKRSPMDTVRALAQKGMAASKLDQKANTKMKEEVEQIEELSKGTLASYVKKSSSKQFVAGHKAATADSGTEKSAIDKAQKRSQGVSKAVDRLTREGVKEELTLEHYSLEEIQEFMQTEDYEQLDELSKKTLKSYATKARNSGKKFADRSARAYAGAANSATGNNFLKKTADAAKYAEKSAKRYKGVRRAINKIAAEESNFDEEGNLIAEKITFSNFIDKLNEQLVEYETKSGVYRHKGSYGSSYQGDDDEDDDKPKKPAEPAVKRGRGRPAGSKSGANQKVGSGKSYGGIAHHTLNLPTSK